MFSQNAAQQLEDSQDGNARVKLIELLKPELFRGEGLTGQIAFGLSDCNYSWWGGLMCAFPDTVIRDPLKTLIVS